MNGRTDNRISQTDWLELARQQSNKLAECRAAHVPSLDWGRISGQKARGGTSAPLRLSWALWVLLPVLILGGAGGTWAFVRHLRSGAPRSVESAVVEPAGERLVPATTRRSVTAPTAKERPTQTEQKATPSPVPAPVKKHRVRPRPKKNHKEVASATRAKPEKKTIYRGTERIIFGTSDNPGGGAIIVPPPAKLKPLWTPKTYKKRGRRNASW